MADQVQITKLNQFVGLGPPEDNVSIPKLVVYLSVEPSDSEDTSNRQGHVYSRIIRRD